jgi:4-oxalmesaconate hydratase
LRSTRVASSAGRKLASSVSPFASEMLGAVRGIDPETGHYFDDTKRYIDGNKKLSAAERAKIFEGNARRVFPRFPAGLS